MRFYDNAIYISPSSLTSFWNCSMAHAFRYRYNEPGIPKLEFMRGHGIHKGLEIYFRTRMIDPELNPLDKDTIDNCVQQAVLTLYDEVEAAKKDPYFVFNGDEVNMWMDFYALSIPQYINEIGQFLNPTSVEEKIKAQIGTYKGKKVILSGFVDLKAIPIQDVEKYELKKGVETVIDYKSGMKAGIYITNKIQLWLYDYIYYANTGKVPNLVNHKLILKKPTKTLPLRSAISHEYTDYDPDVKNEYIRSIIMNAIKWFDAGVEMPTGTTSTFGCSGCNQRYNCEFYGV